MTVPDPITLGHTTSGGLYDECGGCHRAGAVLAHLLDLAELASKEWVPALKGYRDSTPVIALHGAVQFLVRPGMGGTVTGIERLREIACGGEDTFLALAPWAAREVVAHIDAQDQRIRDLEAVLGEYEGPCKSCRGKGECYPAHNYSDPNTSYPCRRCEQTGLNPAARALLTPAPDWPSLHGGVQ